MEPHRPHRRNRQGTEPWENARLFALLDMALADGYIAMSSAKNHYSFWRPVTAIQSGSDPNWTPLKPTPPNPDYPSGHSIEGGAGAEVLKQVLRHRPDQLSRTAARRCRPATPAMTPSQCCAHTPASRRLRDENAYSRVLVGFHFRNATDEGTAYGRKIGERAAALNLRPVE